MDRGIEGGRAERGGEEDIREESNLVVNKQMVR